MKIATIESFVVRAPLEGNKPHWGAGFWSDATEAHPGFPADYHGDITTEYPPVWRIRATYPLALEAVMVRIETDTGIVGWGEAHTPSAPEASKAVIDTVLAPAAIGADPLDIQPIWETLFATQHMRGHTAGFQLEAISAIDIALWDIAGKAYDAPIAKLLGGQLRNRIPVYASSLPRVNLTDADASRAAVCAQAAALVAAGHRSIKVKLGFGVEQDRVTLRMLREAVGPDVELSVDVNGAYDLALARAAGRMMEEEGVIWLEEPLMPEDLRGYTRLTAALDIRVALGECLCNRWISNDFFAAGAVDLIQPDVGRAGGISESKRISDLAEIYGVPFAPHVSIGTAIYIAASLQWAAAGPNLMICEWPLEGSVLGDGIIQTPFAFDSGFVQVPEGPGLGIEIDEAALRSWAA
jgi:D-arabinonate dehydratase/D-galactarolactone cycloisomerase